MLEQLIPFKLITGHMLVVFWGTYKHMENQILTMGSEKVPLAGIMDCHWPTLHVKQPGQGT